MPNQAPEEKSVYELHDEQVERLAAMNRDRMIRQIPKRYQLGFHSFSNSYPEHAVLKASAFKWVSDFKPGMPVGLVLGGQVGCGKTHLGCAILRKVAERGFSIKYQCVSELFLEITAAWNTRESSTLYILEKILKADLVFLDDLGAEPDREYQVDILFNLFNRVFQDEKPTLIVATNLNMAEIAKKLGSGNGQRIASRLGSVTKPLGEFPNVDLRREKMNVAPDQEEGDGS